MKNKRYSNNYQIININYLFIIMIIYNKYIFYINKKNYK